MSDAVLTQQGAPGTLRSQNRTSSSTAHPQRSAPTEAGSRIRASSSTALPQRSA